MYGPILHSTTQPTQAMFNIDIEIDSGESERVNIGNLNTQALMSNTVRSTCFHDKFVSF